MQYHSYGRHGTFYSCPKLFRQLFIIHGLKNGTYVPVAYFLLTTKTTECYKVALQKLKSFLPSTYVPQKVFIDFEKATHTVVTWAWPSASRIGCRFHLGQAWHRRIQKLGLAKVYCSKSAEGSYLRSFFGLPYLPPEKLEDFFLNDFVVNEPRGNASIKKFTNYIYTKYICSSARYPPALWAQHTPIYIIFQLLSIILTRVWCVCILLYLIFFF